MISICIPIYNFNVSRLVEDLSAQAQGLKESTEIILIDDGSMPEWKQQNKAVCQKHIYIELEKNIGRAAIRNLFLNHANYNHLLFLDCDSIVVSGNFLENYILATQENPESVLCGGRKYSSKAPKRNQRLRWKYGIKKESKTAQVRKLNPYQSFMTNNFVVPKKTLETIRFDENLREYGHEDTLFGIELKKKNIQILHLDNPIENGHLESNAVYLKNTEQAIANLIYLVQHSNNRSELINDVKLLRIFHRAKFYQIPLAILFWLFKPLLVFLLKNGFANLLLFDFYKLGTLNKRVKQ